MFTWRIYVTGEFEDSGPLFLGLPRHNGTASLVRAHYYVSRAPVAWEKADR